MAPSLDQSEFAALRSDLLRACPDGLPALELFARLGDPEPPKARAAFEAALHNADLAPDWREWLPRLLLSARPGFGAQCLESLAERYRQTRRSALPIAEMPALPCVLGSSDALARVLLRHPNWAEELLGDPPPAPPGEEVEPDWTSLRIAKYRGLLRIAGRDLLERPFEASLTELSALADRCLAAGLERAARDRDIDPPALLALGKQGGGELNFSSDIDALFLYQPRNDVFDPEYHRALAELIQSFKHHMEVPGEDGFGYRIDLDLRPQGRRGSLANTVEAALTYYASIGAEWERQALIRLRHVAGPPEAAEAFCRQIAPFVYRRSITPDAIRAVHEMKLRVESERRGAHRELEYDLKEGPGGIRDIEFLTQAIQLFCGGRDSALRTGNVLDALRRIEKASLLPEPVTESLRESYLWLRRAEHCVQMVEERQTQRFPSEPAAQLGLARRMGYLQLDAGAARDALLADWGRVRSEVRHHFEALVLEPKFEPHARSGRAPADLIAQEVRGTALFARLSTFAAPFLERSEDSDVDLLDGIGLRGIARVVTSSALAARYLSVRPVLQARMAEADAESLRRRALELAREPLPVGPEDLEEYLDCMRLIRRDEGLLAACVHLGGQVPFEEVSPFLSVLAEACVRWALEAIPSEERELSVLGMGKIAGREFTYHSDLDLIFLHPDGIQDPSRPARIAQRLIHYLTAQTKVGSAYAVDSRLRPSGRQGALVSTYSAFERYQLERAAPWEHFALMRARAIAGDLDAAQSLLERVRDRILSAGGSPWSRISEMRARVERERVSPKADVVDFKTGRGGLMEVDFLASGSLLECGASPAEMLMPSVAGMLRRAAPGEGVEKLLKAYLFLRRVEACTRWVADRGVEDLRLGSETAPLVSELVDPGASPEDLASELALARRSIRSAYDAVIAADSIQALG
ncbi:MAG: hypothetical protein J4G09_15460 [Proteobacteria bacterium]|nr:hypothetical protein [Pseudomonadota bacterium]